MNVRSNIEHDGNLEDLVSGYVALCNQAIAENQDKFWYRQAKRLNKAIWGGANFRTIIYRTDPGEELGEFTLHFDPEDEALRLLPPGDYDFAFSWKASIPYLLDVVHERPEWYLRHPAMLDWNWMTERLSSEVNRMDGRALATGFVLGAMAAALASLALSRNSTERHLK